MKLQSLRMLLLALMGVFSLNISSVLSETIVLKSGKTIEGEVIEKNDKYIKIDFQGVPVTYFGDEIESIGGVKQDLSTIEGIKSPQGDKSKELDNAGVNKDFIDSLALINVGDLSIMLPSFLKKAEREMHDDMFVGKMFQDASKTKSIWVSIDKTPLSNDLKKIVSSNYESHDKAFNPGINPIFIAWSNLWNPANGEASRIDFGDFHGFLIKGTKQSYNKSLTYEYLYKLFRKGDDESLINIIIRSPNDYFLNDAECKYIINTLKEQLK